MKADEIGVQGSLFKYYQCYLRLSIFVYHHVDAHIAPRKTMLDEPGARHLHHEAQGSLTFVLSPSTADFPLQTIQVVRLQITPPQLTFTRELRFSTDVRITITPRATGTEVVHHRGHMFLLSDLFLVCERMTDEERAMERRREGGEGDEVDMWLLYPPLAGKVLRVAEVEDTVFSVAIMRKETLYIHTESIQARDFMLKEFRECIDFASSSTFFLCVLRSPRSKLSFL